jgi:hypothetical protein
MPLDFLAALLKCRALSGLYCSDFVLFSPEQAKNFGDMLAFRPVTVSFY